jgi:hypothetical protein
MREEERPFTSRLVEKASERAPDSHRALSLSHSRHRASAGLARGQRPSGFIRAAERGAPNRNTRNGSLLAVPLSSRLRVSGATEFMSCSPDGLARHHRWSAENLISLLSVV